MEKENKNPVQLLKNIKNAIIYVLALVGLISIVWFLGTHFGVKVPFINNIKEVNVQSTKLNFEDVGELVTQSANTTVVIDNKDSKKVLNTKLKISFSDRRLLFSYNVKVDASVDFTKIQQEVMESKIILKVPHAKVYSAETMKDSLKKYIEEGSYSLEETNESLKAIEDQAKVDAVNNGLLTQADENAKMLLINFVKSEPSFKNFEVEIEYLEEIPISVDQQTTNN